ncbi:hypothetical protein HW132_34085 [Brasilonema sp. CT11]|nr:hypothetical protein [Brasilonema sp. CT11]
MKFNRILAGILGFYKRALQSPEGLRLLVSWYESPPHTVIAARDFVNSL